MAAFTAAAILRLLPYRTASDFGGWVGRTLGPRFRRHEIARYNLKKALPEIDAGESERILDDMWDNFGRLMAEFFHLDTFERLVHENDDSITFEGMEHLEAALRTHPNVIFVGAHFGNWELGALISRRVKVDYASVYHSLHEAYVDRLVAKCRAKLTPKLIDNKAGRKEVVAALKNGVSLCLLVDQKPIRGPLFPFFGFDAKTTTTPAKLALRYGVPLVPFRVERKGGVSFKITVYPPIDVSNLGDDDEGVARITAAINGIFEDWIREAPSQWHWVHRRWPDSIK